MKKCSKCNIKKSLIEFNKDKNKISGYRSNCKLCRKDSLSEYYKVNRDRIIDYKREYYKNNTVEILKDKKLYYNVNREKIVKSNMAYSKKRLKTDINYKLTKNLRTRMNCAIKNNQKSGSAVRDLGCTIEELKIYLENQFQDGMSWDNWSRTGWHMDHIKPLASFDLTNREELLKACHYTNLQPLWAKENISWGAKDKRNT